MPSLNRGDYRQAIPPGQVTLTSTAFGRCGHLISTRKRVPGVLAGAGSPHPGRRLRCCTKMLRRPSRLKALHLPSEPYSRDSAVQPRRREPRRGSLPLSRSWCPRTPGRTGRAAPRLSAAPSAPSTCARTPKSRQRSRTGWAGAGSSRQAVKGVAVRLHRLTTALRLVPSDQQRVGLRFAR